MPCARAAAVLDAFCSLTEELLPFLDHSIHDPGAAGLARRSRSRKDLGQQVWRLGGNAGSRVRAALPPCALPRLAALHLPVSNRPRALPGIALKPSKPMAEDEELQRALEMSMADAATGGDLSGSPSGSKAATSGMWERCAAC